ncbi:ThiF family adenylyltransferase [Streptomyces noursei]|uniref:ThiF family adenylyltransferase n=1 Tax=Streptomyces noursei TaxID=1971 RepID=UPI001964704C|nr:ThiF family adenylyltransferase [Streptomyces noursei]QRX96325.1 ThiF family adenylyltransferase [Streptomyces noursei]
MTSPSVSIGLSDDGDEHGRELTHDAYYAELVTRNRGLLSARDQESLRRATVLVAGCGSIGGAVIEPLVRLGAERFVLAEPGSYDLANLNRQRAWFSDVGRGKALVQAERARDINRFCTVRVVQDGITADNVEELVRAADVIVDAIDVTTPEPIKEKISLHVHAARHRVPVLCGYDVAGTQAMLVYDYRKPRRAPLDGRIRPADVARTGPLGFLANVVPRAAIPLEIIPELLRLVRGQNDGFPQLVYTADLFGVLASRAVVELLAGRPVRRHTVIDVHQMLRPLGSRLRVGAARALNLLLLQRHIVQAKAHRHDPPGADAGR